MNPKATQNIIEFLKQHQLYEILHQDKDVYLGGSLPMYILSGKDDIIINDIDIYTKNYAKTFWNFQKTFGSSLKEIVKTGANIKFNIEDDPLPIQIITSAFDSFEQEVLGEYDCSLVSVGFYPYHNQYLIHPRFLEGMESGNFIVSYEKSNPPRIEKLKKRADNLFGCTLTVVKELGKEDFRPYWKSQHKVDSISDVLSSPPYVQLYLNKYRCLRCNSMQDYLICIECQARGYDYFLSRMKNTSTKRMTVFGGVNGLGKIIADNAEKFGMDVIRTSRHPNREDPRHFNYTLKENTISQDLMEHLLNSHYVILNAYQTLENDHSIWTTTLDTFDRKLAMERFTVNCFGYAELIKNIIQCRKKQIETSTEVGDMILVYMDASESKFENKLQDGKHLELNMAKTACKQIFYTNATLLASLGIICVCYDPGWLSYHGISLDVSHPKAESIREAGVDKIASKSKFLIPPEMSVSALIDHLTNCNVKELYEHKRFAYDVSFYDCFKNIYKLIFHLSSRSNFVEDKKIVSNFI